MVIKQKMKPICKFTVLWPKDSLVPNVIFELRPDSESLGVGTADEPIRFGDKAIYAQKIGLKFGFCDLEKKLLVAIVGEQ